MSKRSGKVVGAWSPERRARFEKTIASKRAAKATSKAVAQVAAPELNGNGVLLTVNGRAYPIEEALAVYAAVSLLKAGQ